MITSLVRLAGDPWSRRQNPFKVPKVRWHQRYPGLTVLVLGVGGTCVMFSRFIYDMFLYRMFEPKREGREVDLILLVRQAYWRKEGEGERPRSLDEALDEQDRIREQRRLEKERQTALASRL